MSDRLSRETSAWLDEVRAAQEPTREDEERVKRALDASVAAGVTCHWERYPVRGDAAAPPAADPGNAGAAMAKAGTVAWAAPLGVVALCAAALLTSGGEEPVAPRTAISSPATAPSVTPTERSTPEHGVPPGTASQQGERPASTRAATTVDAGAPRAASASSPAGTSPKTSRAASAAPAKRPKANGLAAEVALLRRAQAALRRGDGATALRELNAWPGSGVQLLAERRVARVLALCSLGRVAQAQALAADVVRADPDSVQRATLERSCANPSRNRGR
jgi:hypothetical protein